MKTDKHEWIEPKGNGVLRQGLETALRQNSGDVPMTEEIVHV